MAMGDTVEIHEQKNVRSYASWFIFSIFRQNEKKIHGRKVNNT